MCQRTIVAKTFVFANDEKVSKCPRFLLSSNYSNLLPYASLEHGVLVTAGRNPRGKFFNKRRTDVIHADGDNRAILRQGEKSSGFLRVALEKLAAFAQALVRSRHTRLGGNIGKEIAVRNSFCETNEFSVYSGYRINFH